MMSEAYQSTARSRIILVYACALASAECIDFSLSDNKFYRLIVMAGHVLKSKFQ